MNTDFAHHLGQILDRFDLLSASVSVECLPARLDEQDTTLVNDAL